LNDPIFTVERRVEGGEATHPKEKAEGREEVEVEESGKAIRGF